MNGFYVVPVWIKDEGAVVLGGVLGPQARRSVIRPPSRERGGVEGIHLLAPIRGERDVYGRARAVAGRDGEVGGLLEPELHLVQLRHGPDLREAERHERPRVELAAAAEVADTDRHVIDHHPAPGHTRTLVQSGKDGGNAS